MSLATAPRPRGPNCWPATAAVRAGPPREPVPGARGLARAPLGLRPALAHLDGLDPVRRGAGAWAASSRRCPALLESAERAASDGATLLVLSDRGIDAARAALPSLLAVSAVHQHLARKGLRTLASASRSRSGEARDDHQVAALFAFGAEAVCPCRSGVALAGEPAEGRARYREVAREGAAQDPVEDGAVDAAVVLRRPALRSHRPGAGADRRALSRDAVAHRRPGAGRRRGRDAGAPRAGVRGGRRPARGRLPPLPPATATRTRSSPTS